VGATLGIRAVFVITGLALLAACVAVVRGLPETPEEQRT
jgi:hypothetical protein